MNTQIETDNYILKYKGCTSINCTNCFYHRIHNDTCSILKFSIHHNYKPSLFITYMKIIYDYVLDKKKIEKLKDILS